jgi:hypothetical protein
MELVTPKAAANQELLFNKQGLKLLTIRLSNVAKTFKIE